MNHEIRLAEMIATRLCHDLTGPIGAVNNGAEFLEEDGFDMQNEAVQLIISSAHEAVHRLQFYRQAYGRSGDVGEASLTEKKKITVDFFSSSKIHIDWPDSHTDASGVGLGQKMARLMLNLILIVASSAIRGGTLSVRVAQAESGDKQVDISVVGESIKFDADTATILAGHTQDVVLSPKTSQPYLTMQLADELHAQVSFSLKNDSLAIQILQPQLALTEE